METLREPLQTYLDEHPISGAAEGGQMTVFHAGDIALKIARNLEAPPLNEAHRRAHEVGAQRLGGLAVPFTNIAGTLHAHRKCREIPFLPWPTRRESVPVESPVVQMWVPEENSLETYFAEGDVQDVQSAVDGLIQLNRSLVGVGAYPHDQNPTNFVMVGGAVLLRDIGAAFFSTSLTKKVLGGRNIRRGDGASFVEVMAKRDAQAFSTLHSNWPEQFEKLQKNWRWLRSGKARKALGKNKSSAQPLQFTVPR